jgi:hypothetical protein
VVSYVLMYYKTFIQLHDCHLYLNFKKILIFFCGEIELSKERSQRHDKFIFGLVLPIPSDAIFSDRTHVYKQTPRCLFNRAKIQMFQDSMYI